MVTDIKKEEVEKLRGYFTTSKTAVLADYRGVKAEEITALRKELRGVNTRVKVIKNTLARIAAKDTPYEKLASMFDGPVSVAFGMGEEAGPMAKAITEFAKENKNFRILGGMVEGSALDAAGVKTLADMPSKPVARAMLLGVLKAPAGQFVGVMSAAAKKFLYALNAIAEKKQEKQG